MVSKMNQYIITEEELDDLKTFGWDIGYNGQILVHESNIKSRPYNPQAEIKYTPGGSVKTNREREIRIRSDEREKVLDELERWGCGYFGYDVNVPSLMEKIAELREGNGE